MRRRVTGAQAKLLRLTGPLFGSSPPTKNTAEKSLVFKITDMNRKIFSRRVGIFSPAVSARNSAKAEFRFRLKAAKRHVKEAVLENEELGKVDFSLLDRPSDSEVVDERSQPRQHLSSGRTTKKDAALGSGPCLQGH